jgi:hypothetical protein
LPLQHDPKYLFGSEKYHFSIYNLRVTADKFYTVNILKFRIFPNMRTIYKIIMHLIISGETDHFPEKVIIIPSSPID